MRLCLTLFICLLVVPAWGNTRFGFGTIVNVDSDGAHSKKGRPSFTIQYEFANLKHVSLWPMATFQITQKTRKGHRVYFLDGQPSTPEEALAVGRCVTMAENDSVVFVSSHPGPRDPGTRIEPTPQAAIWRVRLPKAFQASLITVNAKKGTQSAPENTTCDIELVFARSGDALTKATAVIVALSNNSDFAVDTSGLRAVGDGISGTIAFEVKVPADSRKRLAEGDRLTTRYELDLSAAADGSLSGSCTGTCGPAAITGTVDGRLLAPAQRPERARLWLQVNDTLLRANRHGYVMIDQMNPPQARILGKKGHPAGEIAVSELQLDDQHLTFTATATISGAQQSIVVEAVVLGGRVLMGSFRATAADGTISTGRLRGGICPAQGSQLSHATDAQEAPLKALREAAAAAAAGK